MYKLNIYPLKHSPSSLSYCKRERYSYLLYVWFNRAVKSIGLWDLIKLRNLLFGLIFTIKYIGDSGTLKGLVAEWTYVRLCQTIIKLEFPFLFFLSLSLLYLNFILVPLCILFTIFGVIAWYLFSINSFTLLIFALDICHWNKNFNKKTEEVKNTIYLLLLSCHMIQQLYHILNYIYYFKVGSTFTFS